MSNWEVENLRVTGFTQPSVVAEPIDQLWAAVVGVPPDQVTQRPKELAVRAEGSFEGARLILSQEPLRTDWLWVADVDPTKPALPTIGKFQTVSDIFLKLAKTWLNRGLSLTRLAWGGVLLLPVADKEEGYRSLAKFLPHVKIDPIRSFDLSYQINWPRTSRVIEGLRINRLSIWSVALVQPVSLTIVVSDGQTRGGPTGPALSACRLQFDINSDATRTEPYAPRQLVPLLDELVESAAEIAASGDVP